MKRKILSIALLIMMLFTAFPAMTVSSATGATITINAPAGVIIEGETFNAYRIFDATVSGTTFAYSITTPFADFDTATYMGAFLAEYFDTAGSGSLPSTLTATSTLKDFLEFKNGDNLDTADDTWAVPLTKYLQDYITAKKTGSATYFTTDTVNVFTSVGPVATGQNSVDFTGLPLGYYLITGTEGGGKGKNADGKTGHETVVAICALCTNDEAVSITLKARVPDIDKHVWHEKLSPDAAWNEYTDVNMTDDVWFKLTTAVPNMNGYKNYYFTVYDDLSGGLTLDESSIKVYIAPTAPETDETVPTPLERLTASTLDLFDLATAADYAHYLQTIDVDYKVEVTNSTLYTTPQGKQIEIDFGDIKGDTATKLTAGYDIAILYKAELNSDAVVTKYDFELCGDPGCTDLVGHYHENGSTGIYLKCAADGECEKPTHYHVVLNGDLGNPNTVYLEYSNNPYNNGDGNTKFAPKGNRGTSGKTKDKTVRVFTFRIPIIKTDEAGNPLRDAKFALYKAVPGETFEWNYRLPQKADNPDQNPVNGTLVEFDEVTAGVLYRHSKTGTSADFTTTTSGQIMLEGLEAGTYYLVELNSPDGYNMLTNAITVVIGYVTHQPRGTAAAHPSKLIEFTSLLTYTVNGDSVKTWLIENKSGPKFPETGGMDRTIIYIVCGVIAFGTGITIVVMFKLLKKKTDKTVSKRIKT